MSPLKIEKHWYLLLGAAMSAAVGAAAAFGWRRRRQLIAHHREQAADLKCWESEGGNVAPTPATSVLP
jgi:hypothetical protein